MSLGDPKGGQIVTFYSYKGGTGRSMALANTACFLGRRLAKRSQRVLAIDWDIDAPGLHRYFPRTDSSAYLKHPGIVDYFWQLDNILDRPSYKKLSGDQGWLELSRILPLQHYIIPDVAEGVDLIKAGRFISVEANSDDQEDEDDDYAERVTSFRWASFYDKYRVAFRCFREYIASLYPWCLIDSRTGVSDVSGVCTMLMPEKMVAVFTPNRQSLEGLLDVVKKAVAYRAESDDPRPLTVFPLPSRFVLEEQKLVQAARHECRLAFQKCLQETYKVTECDLKSYFDAVEIPHVGFYGFKERVAVRDDASQTVATSINGAYERFYERLITLDYAWESWEEATERLLETTEATVSPLVPTNLKAKREMQARILKLFGDEEWKTSNPLLVHGLDQNGDPKDQIVYALDLAHPERDLWVGRLPGASAIQILLKLADSTVRAEVECDVDGQIPLHVIWNDQRILRLTSEAGAVLTLPPDERYAPPPPLRRAQDSQKLDLLFLIDGTTKALSTTEPPAFIPLLDESRSKGWTPFVEKLVLLTAELGKSYGDMRTGILSFGDHSMKFISSSPDLTCRYLIYPEDSEERKLYSRTQDQLRQQLMQIPHTSGGDFVDALGEGLQQCKEAGWRADARKMIVLCGDSPGFSLFKPAPAGADIHLRQIDVDQAATELHVQHGVEITSIYLGVSASKTKNPYNVSEPKAFLDHVRSQYRRLASLPSLAWDDSSFDPKAAAKAIQAVPPLIARGSCYGMVSLDNASREIRSEIEQGSGRFSI